VLGEGPRGSLTKQLVQRLGLDEGREPQVYSVGVKELWELPDDRYPTGRVTHTLGPRTPLVTREPIIFKRLEERRPIFMPGDGFPFVHLVHVQDVAALMASLCGWAPAAGQIYNVAGSEFTSVEGSKGFET
jgi:hypothetical protein